MQTNTSAPARRFERRLTTIPVKLVIKADYSKVDDSAIAVDISPRGACVRTKLQLDPGDWVGVIPKDGFTYAIPTRAVWVREDEFTHWTFVGLEFFKTAKY